MENLKEVRNEMLRLHKTLLDIERANYEAEFGSVTPNQLLQLLFDNERFVWLREISTLISEIDEMFASRKGIDAALASKLLEDSKGLFQENVADRIFHMKYRANLELESEVAVHHEKLIDLFEKEKA